MAIPKICGIENEFGFSVFDGNNRQITNEADFLIILNNFVGNYLASKRSFLCRSINENRHQGVLGDKILDKKRSVMEIDHDALIQLGKMGRDDGFLLNGARFYRDVFHPEYSTPECLTPLDLVAHDKTSELVMLDALEIFHQQFGGQYKVFVHKNNSDGQGVSFGSHLNVLLDRKTVLNCENFQYFLRHYIPFQIGRIILVGGGKLGSENQRPDCHFQISQRADFFEDICGTNTVDKRPIFNTRDEPHAEYSKYFRLHDISTDALMCETALFLRIALTQIVLAMIEDGFLQKDLYLKCPLKSIRTVSRDLQFKSNLTLANGSSMTAIELLEYYLIKSKEYLERNPMDSQHLAAINLAFEIIGKLRKDIFSTFGELDWTTALKIAESKPNEAAGYLLKFREISDDGLYYRLLKAGKIKRMVDEEMILGAKHNPPENTRAHIRGGLLKRYGDRILNIDWELVAFDMDGNILHLKINNPALAKLDLSMLI